MALATIWTVALINCASVAAGGHTALVLTLAKVGLVLGVGISALIFAPGDWASPGGLGTRGYLRGRAEQRARRLRGFRRRHAGRPLGL